MYSHIISANRYHIRQMQLLSSRWERIIHIFSLYIQGYIYMPMYIISIFIYTIHYIAPVMVRCYKATGILLLEEVHLII